jgi:5-methylcytosine-specific restriction endonuclease McrA
MKTSENFARIRSEARNINFVVIIHAHLYESNHCFYCGQQLDTGNRTRDHLIPRIRAYNGMQLNFRRSFGKINTVCSCFACNNMKGSKSLIQFRQWVKTTKPTRYKTILHNIDKVLTIPFIVKLRNVFANIACIYI